MAPASTIPTEAPSGILWSVTASIIIVDFLKPLRIPSCSPAPIWRCGTSRSSTSRNRIPNRNPTAAGTNANFPMPSDMSIAGISSDHTEAATITPEANPSIAFCSITLISPRNRNTHAAPSAVPASGIITPASKSMYILLLPVFSNSDSISLYGFPDTA